MFLKLLHMAGLTNLSEKELDDYYSLKHSFLSPLTLKFLHVMGLTNLTENDMKNYTKYSVWENTLGKDKSYIKSKNSILLRIGNPIRWLLLHVRNSVKLFYNYDDNNIYKDHLVDLRIDNQKYNTRIRPLIIGDLQIKTQIRSIVIKKKSFFSIFQKEH